MIEILKNMLEYYYNISISTFSIRKKFRVNLNFVVLKFKRFQKENAIKF